VLLQRRGVAAVVVLTEPFRDQVERVMAYQPSDRPLPAIVLPHPMQNLGPEALAERSLLLADAAEALVRGHRERGEPGGGGS
jgi:hypothetical protein